MRGSGGGPFERCPAHHRARPEVAAVDVRTIEAARNDGLGYAMHIDGDCLEFADIEELGASIGFADGLVVAADIVNSSGGILYKAGVELGPKQCRKLSELLTNFDQRYGIRVEVNDELVEHVTGLVREDFSGVETRLRNKKAFARSLEPIPELEEFVTGALAEDPGILLRTFKAAYRERVLTGDAVPELLQLALIRSFMAIVVLEFLQEHCDADLDPEKDYVSTFMASLHFAAAIEPQLAQLHESDKRQRRTIYAAAMSRAAKMHVAPEDPLEILPILDLAGRYFARDYKLAVAHDRCALLANAVVVADEFARLTGGFFDGRLPLKEVIDRLLQAQMNGRLSTTVVEALAKGFPYLAMFDFYSELENILEGCPIRAGRPHPMHSGLSATLVICSANEKSCQHFGGQVSQPVYIAEGGNEVPAGHYGPCNLMTPQLKSLYEEYYDRIKADVSSDRNTEFASS